jgi:hypothetical protein
MTWHKHVNGLFQWTWVSLENHQYLLKVHRPAREGSYNLLSHDIAFLRLNENIILLSGLSEHVA